MATFELNVSKLECIEQDEGGPDEIVLLVAILPISVNFRYPYYVEGDRVVDFRVFPEVEKRDVLDAGIGIRFVSSPTLHMEVLVRIIEDDSRGDVADSAVDHFDFWTASIDTSFPVVTGDFPTQIGGRTGDWRGIFWNDASNKHELVGQDIIHFSCVGARGLANRQIVYPDQIDPAVNTINWPTVTIGDCDENHFAMTRRYTDERAIYDLHFEITKVED